MRYKIQNYNLNNSLLENILINRGIKDIDAFLDLDVQDENPLNYTNMQKGCALLYEHIRRENKIAVLVD